MEVSNIMMQWKNEYSIGIKLLDEQHKHIFELLNNTYELLKNDSCLDKYSKIDQTIEDLYQYAKYHFKYEEAYMLQINYQNYSDQKIEHEDFIKKVDSLNLYKKDEDPDVYIMKVFLFISDWIINHILYKDRLIVIPVNE